MPLMRLIAENVGPFERLDIDFSDGNGKPHRGPHILAGVNGSGKSTVLRAIAWALSYGEDGFPRQEWRHLLWGDQSRVAAQLTSQTGLVTNAASSDSGSHWKAGLTGWVRSLQLDGPLGMFQSLALGQDGRVLFSRSTMQDTRPLIAAYAPARALTYIGPPPERDPAWGYRSNCLAFEGTAQNAIIQRWWVDLFSRRALAKEMGRGFEQYEQALCRLQDAVKAVCGDGNIDLEVELGSIIEPRVGFQGKRLNFSQLSDGVRTTIGWLADFMMRQEEIHAVNGRWILLLDEIDLYLHPRWQRTLLPAMRAALPETQIIASSHSPFVISSCADAKIHVLELDAKGVAHARPPQAAPFGESVSATLSDIFGVESQFDAQTDQDLREWNDLKRDKAAGKLSPQKGRKLEALTSELSERSEELKLIVASPPLLSAKLVSSLTGKAKQAKRNGSKPR